MCERGEQIRTLTIEEMAEKFLAKQKKRISAIPHNSISAKRYLQMEHHARWFLKYAGQNQRPIHKIPRPPAGWGDEHHQDPLAS